MFREFLRVFLSLLRDVFRGRSRLTAENALLRQQVIVLGRSAPKPRLKPRDRWSIATITKVFPGLLAALSKLLIDENSWEKLGGDFLDTKGKLQPGVYVRQFGHAAECAVDDGATRVIALEQFALARQHILKPPLPWMRSLTFYDEAAKSYRVFQEHVFAS
jgi:hypothetical protein